MDFKVKSVEDDLDYIICKKESLFPSIAMKWKWRILNEYPEDLKQLVLAWACDQALPEVSYNGVSLERIVNSTSFGFLDAVDLLYIMHKDPAGGYDLFCKNIVRSAGKR